MTQKVALVVEDEIHYMVMMMGVLESMGCTVDTAITEADARDRIDENEYDLIVLDNAIERDLPNGGLELMHYVRKLSERNSTTPIILHTGDDRAEVKRRVQELGGVYLFKRDEANRLAVLKAALETKP